MLAVWHSGGRQLLQSKHSHPHTSHPITSSTSPTSPTSHHVVVVLVVAAVAVVDGDDDDDGKWTSFTCSHSRSLLFSCGARGVSARRVPSFHRESVWFQIDGWSNWETMQATTLDREPEPSSKQLRQHKRCRHTFLNFRISGNVSVNCYRDASLRRNVACGTHHPCSSECCICNGHCCRS